MYIFVVNINKNINFTHSNYEKRYSYTQLDVEDRH